jgi:hypothetical protein
VSEFAETEIEEFLMLRRCLKVECVCLFALLLLLVFLRLSFASTLQGFVNEGCDVAAPTVVARQGMDWTKLDLKKASVVRKEGLSALSLSVSLCISLLIFFFASSG